MMIVTITTNGLWHGHPGRVSAIPGFHGQDARATGGGADCAAFEAGAAAGGTYAANTPAPRRMLIKTVPTDAEKTAAWPYGRCANQ
jgi:hypothetical protein